MRPLSKSIADIRLSYDVIVVGSGYGGGVAASRLARCGKRVCLLERGREFPIGDFPDTPSEATGEVQVTREGKHLGDPMGLYDLRLGKDMHVFIGCGLGGTSLVNANVSLPIDDRVWEDPVWPDELVADADRKEGERRARRMLSPVPYPEDVPLAKLSAMRLSAGSLGNGAIKPPINVTFERTVNHANVEQPACTLCGDCCSGCNVGAKNTTQMNYLPDAVNHGAEIYTGTQVRHVRKEHGKWRVFFDLISTEREKFDSPSQSIVADVVVLAAGTLGSTEILLRSRENGLPVSDRVGHGFTGNGDILAFAYNNEVEINGIGFGHPPHADVPPVGPCISGAIDLRRTDNFEHGMIIEEGSIPSGLAPLLPAIMVGNATVFGDDTDRGIKDELS
ncbi:MAG: GMC family oxidoreductase N-terminal domain-containing protein, partial [Hyphomicrobiaceae bacterium]